MRNSFWIWMFLRTFFDEFRLNSEQFYRTMFDEQSVLLSMSMLCAKTWVRMMAKLPQFVSHLPNESFHIFCRWRCLAKTARIHWFDWKRMKFCLKSYFIPDWTIKWQPTIEWKSVRALFSLLFLFLLFGEIESGDEFRWNFVSIRE